MIKKRLAGPFRMLRRAVSRPEMVPVWLFSPPVTPPVEAVTRLVPGLAAADARRFREELLGNHEFFDQINRRVYEKRRRRLIWNIWYEFLYMLLRAVEPEVMVETGVFDGPATATALAALRANGKGVLHSIDLPATEAIAAATDTMPESKLPPGELPGWIIPDALRDRHVLELGDARALLPGALARYPAIDIFMHDSLHTYDHMMFEFQNAWPKIRSGGHLLSDDVMWNAAFHQFCGRVAGPYLLVGEPYLGVRGGAFGAVRKT